MDNIYQKLNEFFNLFCIYYNYPLYMDHISEYLSLSVLASRMISMDFSQGKIAETVPVAEQSLPLNESLDLCNKFVEKYLSTYYDTWKEYLSNGVIDFTDSEQIILDGNMPQGSKTVTFNKDNGLFREIDVDLKHDYSDPATIIHEFLHQLNMSDTQDGNETVSRTLFTEVVSIYFETLMYRFMENQGYSRQEIAKVQFRRVQDFYKSLVQSNDELMMLRDYHIFGKISDDNFEKTRKLGLLHFDTKETYQMVARDFNDRIVAEGENIDIYLNCKLDIFKSLRYVIGTSLAYWAISQNDSNMPWKMLMFNEDLAEDRDLGYAFSRFSLNPGDMHAIVSGTEKELIRCSKNLNYSSKKKK